MEDYEQITRITLSRFFSPEGKSSELILMSTRQVLDILNGVFPFEAIDEHTIYEALTELRFTQVMSNTKSEDEMTEELILMWRLYKITTE